MGKSARKRIHYLRAVFNPGARGNIKFETMIANALQMLPTMARTEVPIASHGVLAIRHRQPGRGRLKLAIGAGAPGESMSTMGLRVRSQTDAELAESPPENRAFKTADAFCLISGDEVLMVVEGMRVSVVEAYLRQLISNANQAAGHSAFELRPVGDQDQEAILADEGVKEVRLSGTAYQAEAELERTEYGNTAEGIIFQLWEETKDRVRALLSEQVENERQQQVLAEHWADLNITTTIQAKGGSRAEPVVLESMQSAGMELIEERPDNVSVTLITEKGSTISGSSLVLGKFVNLSRNDEQNDLPYMDVFLSLEQYQAELIQQRRWHG
jgi:hypothetical protein